MAFLGNLRNTEEFSIVGSWLYGRHHWNILVALMWCTSTFNKRVLLKIWLSLELAQVRVMESLRILALGEPGTLELCLWSSISGGPVCHWASYLRWNTLPAFLTTTVLRSWWMWNAQILLGIQLSWSGWGLRISVSRDLRSRVIEAAASRSHQEPLRPFSNNVALASQTKWIKTSRSGTQASMCFKTQWFQRWLHDQKTKPACDLVLYYYTFIVCTLSRLWYSVTAAANG